VLSKTHYPALIEIQAHLPVIQQPTQSLQLIRHFSLTLATYKITSLSDSSLMSDETELEVASEVTTTTRNRKVHTAEYKNTFLTYDKDSAKLNIE